MRKKIILSACIVGITLFLLVLYYLYPFGNKEVITLGPDEGVTKMKPKDPGGLIVPHSDSSVYDTLHSSNSKFSAVHVLPDPEDPMEIARNASSAQPQFLDSIDEILANIEYYEESILDNSLSGSVDSEHVLPNMLASKDTKLNAHDHDDRMVLVSGTKLRVFKALEDRYEAPHDNVVLDIDGGYKIQLSSASSYEDAKIQWKQIKQRHHKILNNANLIIKKVEGKNERIFYLVMAGSYPSLNYAKMICRQLSFKKQNCIVTK